MFRRLPHTLPKDADYPRDLTKLGFFINDKDQIKYTNFPEDPFRWNITTNERYNDCHHQAVKSCISDEVIDRLSKLGVEQLWLPNLTTAKPTPKAGPTMPILTTVPNKLKKAKRVVVIVNRTTEVLCIWSWKTAKSDEGIEAGSVLCFVKEMRARAKRSGVDEDDTAIVMLNPGQLLYSHKHHEAMTPLSWQNMTRPSALHMAPVMDEKANRIEGNTTSEQHLRWVMKNVICDEDFVAKDAQLFFVGVGDGGMELLEMLDEEWPSYSEQTAAIALIGLPPFHMTTCPISLDNHDFLSALATRGRAWDRSPHPFGTALANPTKIEQSQSDSEGDATRASSTVVEPHIFFSPTWSAGDSAMAEDAMAQIGSSILEWFQDIAAAQADGEDYANDELEISEEIMKEHEAPPAADGSGWGSGWASEADA